MLGGGGAVFVAPHPGCRDPLGPCPGGSEAGNINIRVMPETAPMRTECPPALPLVDTAANILLRVPLGETTESADL